MEIVVFAEKLGEITKLAEIKIEITKKYKKLSCFRIKIIKKYSIKFCEKTSFYYDVNIY